MEERTTCAVDGCERKPRSRFAEWCNTHYFRVRRTGSAGTAEIWDRRRRPCGMADCDRLAVGRGFCDKHIQRVQKWGDPFRVDPKPAGARHGCWLGDDAGYTAAHDRVKAKHGPASGHVCVQCAEPAAHWAYDHADPNEKRDGRGIPFSLDIGHYRPMCVPCHKAMDLTYLEVSHGGFGAPTQGQPGTP